MTGKTRMGETSEVTAPTRQRDDAEGDDNQDETEDDRMESDMPIDKGWAWVVLVGTEYVIISNKKS